MFSKSCQYAVQAILYITLNAKYKNAIGLKEIADSQNIPIHYLSKIMQLLVKHKILSSITGPKGGFRLNKSPDKLKLIRIVRIVDGLDMLEQCSLGIKKCSDKAPCPIHDDYKIIRDHIKALWSSKTITQLCSDIENKQLF